MAFKLLKCGISDSNSIVYSCLYTTFTLKTKTMVKKAFSASEIPLCINVLRLLNYRLASGELILSDWLTVKQIAFNISLSITPRRV